MIRSLSNFIRQQERSVAESLLAHPEPKSSRRYRVLIVRITGIVYSYAKNGMEYVSTR